MTSSSAHSPDGPTRPSLVSATCHFWVGLDRGWQATLLGLVVVGAVYAV